VREDRDAQYRSAIKSGLIIPSRDARDRETHRGVVLALGPPAQVNGHDVPHGFNVGDEVVFHWEHNEIGHTRPWTDGKDACWIPHHCVDAVIE
jgi:co-chaperonin GroES (HSP10)